MYVGHSIDAGWLQKEIERLVAEGDAREACHLYALYATVIGSAAVHHAAFVAAREYRLNYETLLSISKKAEQCSDFDKSELDLARDWAIYEAEAKRNFGEAVASIDEVVRSRRDDEGQDANQLPIDRLARCKIMLFSGEVDAALEDLESLASKVPPEKQVHLDIQWWYCIAAIVAGKDALGVALARQSLEAKLDPKPARYRAWHIVTTPFVGTRLARRAFKRKLGL